MEEKGCLGFVTHVMDAHSILLLVGQKFTGKNSFFKLLFGTQPAYIPYMFPIYIFLIKKTACTIFVLCMPLSAVHVFYRFLVYCFQ